MSIETLEGYVIDIACVRKVPRQDLLNRAKEHSRDCTLMGHCIESGFALVDDSDRLSLLDSEATAKILHAVETSHQDRGIRLRVQRKLEGDEARTQQVEAI